jgi:hypothetical protein
VEADFDDYKIDFLGEFESIFETALAHESGPYIGGLFDEKNQRSKISLHGPFKLIFLNVVIVIILLINFLDLI